MRVAFYLLFMSLFSFSLLQAAMPKFLTAEEAFRATMSQQGEMVHVEIALGESIYLYQDKVQIKTPQGITAEYKLPAPQMHEGLDGPEAIYKGTLGFDIKLLSTKPEAREIAVTVAYQGCSEQGLCYQPMEHTQKFTVDFSKAAASDGIADLSESDEIKALFQKSFIIIIISFFGLGLLLSLTPCVFPMIPILSSIIVAQGEKITTKKAFFLSLVYVLAMAAAYTIAGILAGLFGSNIQAALQTPWVIILFSLTFMGLAFSMFGFYDIEMPKWIQTRLSKASHEAEGHGIWGVAVMGFLSALIVGPCVAAPLAGALAYIGESGDALLGGVALFAMSIGMGLPLLAIGVGAGKLMPKPGAWMDSIKAIFGVLMIGLAIWMLDRIVSENATMIMIAALLMISSVYIGAMDTLDKTSSGWRRFRKGLGLFVFIYAIILFIGSFTKGSLDDPLKYLYTGQAAERVEEGLKFTEQVDSPQSLQNLLAKAGDKVVFVDFTAKWCAQCKELEKGAFKDPRVVEATKDFILAKADLTTSTEALTALQKELEVAGPPALRFFKNGQEISRASRIQGDISAEAFLKKLKEL